MGDEQALLSHLQPVGGLSDKSPSYKYLVAVLLEMDQKDRSRFLDFVSSCPRLPPGGIAKFHVEAGLPEIASVRQSAVPTTLQFEGGAPREALRGYTQLCRPPRTARAGPVRDPVRGALARLALSSPWTKAPGPPPCGSLCFGGSGHALSALCARPF